MSARCVHGYPQGWACPGCGGPAQPCPHVNVMPPTSEPNEEGWYCPDCGGAFTNDPREDEPDGAPCCADPGCQPDENGRCTFPGYADNH